ncbi:MAG TPA: Ig-like domain-containing protein [Micromonosporaceae bacterium]
MSRLTHAWTLVAVGLATVSLVAGSAAAGPRLVADTATGAKPSRTPGSGAATGARPVTVVVTPVNGSRRQPVSTEIGLSVAGGVPQVTLAPANGRPVGGALRDDGTSWVPARPLAYATRYTATVTVRGATGRTTTATTTFTTMARPRSTGGSGLYLFDGRTYGVAMPVVAEFSPGIPAKNRAAVQRRMFVRTDPPQPGVWHWLPNGTQAYYRAPRYWKPGTSVSVRLALEGLPVGKGRYGDRDRTATARIGGAFEMRVDNATKVMTVYENGTRTRTMPVSLGKRSTPSSSGTLVVMDKLERTIFDTRNDPDPADRYVIEIAYAQRMTWGGEYIHAAPWSVDAQGRRNVSHGCVNLSTANAQWLFARTKIGDPITITGTERRITPGNGWTAWSLTWAEFAAGSALPVPPDLG